MLGPARRLAPSTTTLPHQRLGTDRPSGGPTGPTFAASTQTLPPVTGSWTCSCGPCCTSSCLNAVPAGARPSRSLPAASADRGTSVTAATQPSGGGGADGGQPAGGGSEGLSAPASTQAGPFVRATMTGTRLPCAGPVTW